MKPGPQDTQQGLSLIELMIAMALGLILTLGVVQIFLGSGKTYRLSEGLAKMQENARFSLGSLQREVRMAGHFGCLVSPLRLTNHLDENGANYEDLSYGSVGTDFVPLPVIGWEAQGTGLDEEFEIQTVQANGGNWTNGSNDAIPGAIQGQMLPGTDFLMVNAGEQAEATLSGNGNGIGTLGTQGESGIDAGTIVFTITGDCRTGDLFQQTNNADATTLTKGVGAGGNEPGNTASSDFGTDYDEDGRVFTYQSTAYYIGEGASGEPALFRERLDAGNTVGRVELAEGVENMQALYGLSNGNERQAQRYVTAADVNDWGNVVSVRIALLFRSDDRVLDETEQRTFNLSGTEVTSLEDRRARVLGISTIGIRNMLE